MNDIEYALIKRKIRDLIGIDLEAYKVQQMRRRLDAHVMRNGGDVTAFCRTVEADAAALEELRNMITINVSEFFRDAAQFQTLREQIMPDLLRANAGKLKIWSAACSHGEEPYSVAIILDELTAGSRAQIVATDIDKVVLERARIGGPYHPNEMRNVKPETLQRYFTDTGGGYRVVDTIRKRVEFRELNLLTGRFDRDLDLIICRNVMIYFSDETKQRLFERFHESLRPSGVLFVGGTEALLGAETFGFSRVSGNFYRRVELAQRERLSA